MGIPYAFVKVMKREAPYLEVEGKDPKAKMTSLMQPGKMKGKYLGACLDSCRWGGSTTVMWETDIRGLMGFIQRWKEENDDDDVNLYHEIPLDQRDTKFELPHIFHEHCPRDKNHLGTFVDAGGRVRCSQREVKRLRPSFIVKYNAGWDELSQMPVKGFYEERPIDPSSWEEDGTDLTDKDEFETYLEKLVRFESEKPSERVVDVCYAILSDREVVLPFETVLRRLNLNYDSYVRGVVFPFDGWDLAYYLQRWREQSESPPWFAEKKENWPSNRAKIILVDAD